MAFVTLTLYMHLGGTFERNPKLSYVGGELDVWDIDPDIVSYHTFCEMVREAGYKPVSRFYYLRKGFELEDGLMICYDNVSFIEMITHMRERGEIHIYVEHGVDEPILVDDVLMLSGSDNGGNEDFVGGVKDTGIDINDVGDGGLNNNGANLHSDQESHDLHSDVVNVTVVEVGDYEDFNGVGEIEIDPFGEFDWVSDNENEEIQDIRAKFKKFKDDTSKRTVGPTDIPPEMDFEGLVKEIKKRMMAYKSKTGQTSGAVGDGTGENEARSGEDTDYIDSSDIGSYGTDEDGKLLCKKNEMVFYDPSDPVPSFHVGMIFEGPSQFKEALNKYAIAKRFDFKFVRNEKKRTRAVCKADGCPYVIFAGVDNRDGLFKLKTLKPKHECTINFKNSRATYKVLADHFLPKLRIIPELKLLEMVQLCKEELHVDVSKSVCKRARTRAQEMISGRYHYEFKRLFDYAAALREVDSKAHVELMVERPTPKHKPKFLRFYVCLDGCFLKGTLRGELLVAIGRYGNNAMYPLAWAMVEVENRQTWSWFLENLMVDIQIGDGSRFTIMSDMQKGLIEAVQDLMPRAEHRFCARHWFANWKKNHRTTDLHKQFWMCCKATTEADFLKKAKKLGEIKGSALEDLLKKNPRHWCRAFFSTRCLSDSVDNNIAEAFNARIIQARHMSIISMFEQIRHYVMERIVNMKKAYGKWTKEFCPRICEKIEQNRELSSFCHVVWNGSSGYEVQCHKDTFVVKVEDRKCTCKSWDLTGIPCPHAICVILYRKEKVEDNVAVVYKRDWYEQLYSKCLPALPGDKFWPDTMLGEIDPPLIRKLPGRPKKNRLKEDGETNRTNLSRKGIKMRCQICFKLGHNSRKCPNKGIESENQPAPEQQTQGATPAPEQQTQGAAPAPQQQTQGTTHTPAPIPCTESVVIIDEIPYQSQTMDQSSQPAMGEVTPIQSMKGRGRGRGRGRGKSRSTTGTQGRKGKNVMESVPTLHGPQGRKIMQGWGVYTNEKTGLQIFNPGMSGMRIISVPQTKNSKEVASSSDTCITSYTGYEQEGSRIKELIDDLLGPKDSRPIADILGTQESNSGNKKAKTSGSNPFQFKARSKAKTSTAK